MPSVVIKPARDRDEYVVWSTVTESPHGHGTRAQMLNLLRAGIRGNAEPDADTVLRRADHWGSSAMGGWTEGHWDDDEFIFHQAGWLHRRDLWRVASMMDGDGCPERDVLDLLTPLEDDADERNHLVRVTREYGDRVVSLEAERRMAGLALRQLADMVEQMGRGR